jgi:hypothetical protein
VGAYLAKGSRFLPEGSCASARRWQALIDRALTALTNRLFSTGYTDIRYGYTAVWRDAVRDLKVGAARSEAATTLNIRAAKAGLPVAEVPSVERHPAMHHSLRDDIRVLRTIIAERISAPVDLAGGRGGR